MIRLLVGISVVLPLLTGCNRGPEMVPVTGQVLYKNKPLEYGSVMFAPADGGEPAKGPIQPDGSFQLKTITADGDVIQGVRVGSCSVRITAFESQRPGGGGVSPDAEMMLGRSAVPRKYQSFGTSGLTVDVSPDMELPVVLNLE